MSPRDDETAAMFGYPMALLSRLDRIIELLETQGHVVVLPHDRTSSSVPSARQLNGSSTPPKRRQQSRNIGEDTYRRHAPQMVHMLLQEGEQRPLGAGKLTKTIYHELGLGDTTFGALMKRILLETKFLTVSRAPRGQAPFVKIHDSLAARAWLRTMESSPNEDRGSQPEH